MKKIILLSLLVVSATGCKQFTCVECRASSEYNDNAVEFCGKDRHRQAEEWKSNFPDIPINCTDK